jgi:hypothetical protein
MTIQERGDELLTAYVNKNFERAITVFSEANRQRGRPYKVYENDVIALHGYINPSITDTKVADAIVESVNALRAAGIEIPSLKSLKN